MKYFISKDVVGNKDIDDIDIIIMLILNNMQSISDNSVSYICFDINSIYYRIYNNFNFTQRDIKLIKDSINHLIKLGLINVITKHSNNYVIDSCDVFINTKQEERYISISEDEFRKIVLSSLRFRYTLLRYYLNVISTINNKTKVGFTSIMDLARLSFIDKSTALDYNKRLEDMELLYIARSNTIQRYDNGTIKKLSNTYGKFIDKDKVVKNFELHNNNVASSNGYDNDNFINRRSIKTKYNHFVKGKYRGDVKELYNLCVLYNDSLSDDDINSGMSRLDLGVFNQE